jgi:hypothetical protein
MPHSLNSFRTTREFANASQAQFNLNLNRAGQFINAAWGPLSTGTDETQYTQTDIGTELVFAHFLARAQFRAMQVANGGPAIARGNVSAESIGPGSVSYDVASATEEGVGYWNQTDYGREYIQSHTHERLNRSYYSTNRDSLKVRGRDQYRNNREQCGAHSAARRARMRRAEGRYTAADVTLRLRPREQTFPGCLSPGPKTSPYHAAAVDAPNRVDGSRCHPVPRRTFRRKRGPRGEERAVGSGTKPLIGSEDGAND